MYYTHKFKFKALMLVFATFISRSCRLTGDAVNLFYSNSKRSLHSNLTTDITLNQSCRKMLLESKMQIEINLRGY